MGKKTLNIRYFFSIGLAILTFLMVIGSLYNINFNNKESKNLNF